MEMNDDLNDMRADIDERVQLVLSQAYDYTNRFEPYSYLWEEDRQEYLGQFLKYGHALSPEELEAKFLGTEPPLFTPRLEQFKIEVSHYSFHQFQ